MSKVIFYKWDGSPYSSKVESALALKGIVHSVVHVARMLPRPELSDLLGISYRRVPVLAIGNDVYCDTSIIITTLERRFPVAEGYGTLFPPTDIGNNTEAIQRKDTGMIKAFVKHYVEGVLVPIFASLISWEDIPDMLLKDREDFRGGPIDVEKIVKEAPIKASTLSSHLALVEEQLSDGRQYLFGTVAPNLADLSLQTFLSWARPMPSANNVINSSLLPLTNKWLDRVTLHIGTIKASYAKAAELSGDAAAETIMEAAYEPNDIVGFNEREAERLSLQKGMKVNVAPEDTGRNHPTVGTLVALNREEVVIEVKPTSVDKTVRVHFPRLGFSIVAV